MREAWTQGETCCSTDEEQPRYVKRVGEGGVVHRQAHAALGELVFEWYLKGRERALSYAQKKGYSEVTRQDLVHGMVLARMKQDIDLANVGWTLHEKAFIPLFQREPQYPAYKLIVGLVTAREDVEEGQVWTLRGDQKKEQTGYFTWKVHVRSNHLPGHKNVGRLAAIKTVFRNGELLSAQRVFDTILTKVGGLWVDSRYENRLYNGLRPLCKGRATIEKPYHPSAEWEGYQPDFVLRAGEKSCVIEVWGMMSQDEYREHALIKQEVYREYERHGVFRFLEWDVEREQEQGLRRLLHDVKQWLDTVAPPIPTQIIDKPSQTEASRNDIPDTILVQPKPPTISLEDPAETIAQIPDDLASLNIIEHENPSKSPSETRSARRNGLETIIQPFLRWLLKKG